MQTNKLIDSDNLDKTKCYIDQHATTYLGKFKEKKTIVRYGQQAHTNIFKYGNSMDDKFIEIRCRSNTPTLTYRSRRSGGRRKKRNSITKKHRRVTHTSKKNRN